MRLLLIDDSEIDREITKKSINIPNLIIDEANNAFSGLEMMKVSSYDCIIIDHFLPDLDGLKLLQEIRNNTRLTPIIVVSSQGDELLVAKYFKIGATDYLPKSELKNLTELITNAVAKFKKQVNSLNRNVDILQDIQTQVERKLT